MTENLIEQMEELMIVAEITWPRSLPLDDPALFEWL
jgi:hypothetical protein